MPFEQSFYKYRAIGKELVPTDVIDDEVVKYIIGDSHIFIMSGIPYIYINGVYQRDDGGIIIKNLIGACIPPEIKTITRIERIYKLLITQLSIQRKYEQINQFDKSWVNFLNGMLDLKTMKLHEHSPDYYSINQIPHEWDNDYQIPDDSVTVDFINSLIQNETDRQMFLEYAGYCLTADIRFQKMLYIRGKGGIGKSVLLKMVENAVGTDNISALTVQNLNDRFSPIFLLGKTLNLYADISATEMSDTSGFKTITGEDTCRGEIKGGSIIFFHPYCKLLFSANRIPHANDDRTNAYYRRLMILQLNQRAKHIDNLTSKLEADTETFLHLIVKAVHGAYIRGYLTESESSKRTVVELELESDSVASFLYEKTTKSETARTERKKLFEEYELYCSDMGRPSKSQVGFYSSLSDKGYSQRKINGTRYFIGLELIDNDSTTSPPAEWL